MYDDPSELHDHYENQVDAVVDGGVIYAGNSTIIDFSEGDPEIIRRGKGAVDWLENA